MNDLTDDLEYVRSLTTSPRLHDFAAFIDEERGDNVYPWFNVRSIVRVPQLAPNVFAFDFRNGLKDGLLIAHAGTDLDREYGFNITGATVDSIYPIDANRENVLEGYRCAYREKKKFYSRRTIQIGENDWNPHRVAESLLFPCSENQIDINYGWGILIFETVETIPPNKYVNW